MPILIPLLALFAPRLVLLLVALFTDFLARAYDGWLLPVLGFFFLPLTTLAYAWAINSAGGIHGPGWTILIVLAVLFDLGATGWKLRRR